jgi:hypothetical protein
MPEKLEVLKFSNVITTFVVKSRHQDEGISSHASGTYHYLGGEKFAIERFRKIYVFSLSDFEHSKEQVEGRLRKVPFAVSVGKDKPAPFMLQEDWKELVQVFRKIVQGHGN